MGGAFGEEEKEKLIEYVMKEDDDNYTALHYASVDGHEEIIFLLLNTFGQKKTKLIEYMMKEDSKNCTVLHGDSHKEHEVIINLLLSAFNEIENDNVVEENYNKYAYTALHHASNI